MLVPLQLALELSHGSIISLNRCLQPVSYTHLSFILLIGTEENILYFFVVHNEEDLENKITISSYTLMSYDCVSKQVSSYSQLPSDMVDRNSEALFIYDGYIYFASIDGLCKTDINFIHKETIYTYAENEWYGCLLYTSIRFCSCDIRFNSLVTRSISVPSSSTVAIFFPLRNEIA